MTPDRRRVAMALALLALPAAAPAAGGGPGIDAPNVVPVSPLLVTSGQPTAASLASLGQQGFQAVLYLAPPTVEDAVPDEPQILARQHIEFANVPIAFGKPGRADFEQVATTLEGWRGKKVLVHCQVNMRASSMVFLYRTLRLKEKPEAAYEAVEKVWSPRGAWRDLIVLLLRENQVAFDPY